MSKPLVGFVILVWNSEKVIDKCLCAIEALTEIEPKVIVIDNGSTDKTNETIENHIKAYPNHISLIQYNINKGTTVSRNEGIRKLQQSNTDYLCILDSDTEINDHALLTMMDELDTHLSYGMIGPQMRTSSGSVQMSARCFPILSEKIYKAVPVKSIQEKGEKIEKQEPINPDDTSYPVDYLMSACWLIKPEILKKSGLLDEKIFYAPEDAEFCIRVWKAGYQVAYCPKAEIIHEWQRLSKKRLISKMNWEHIKGLIYMFKKHKYIFSTKRLKATFPQMK